MSGNSSLQFEGNAGLAAIAEGIERLAWKDIVEAAPGWLRSAAGVVAEEHGGVLMLAASGLDHLLFNRAIGLGEQQPATDDEIDALLDRYRLLNVPHYWIHRGPYSHPDGLDRQLQSHGLQPYRRSWVKMIGPVTPLAAMPSSVHVRQATAGDAVDIASIAGPAFDLPQRGAELLAMLIDRPNWHVLVAEVEGQRIATAGMYVNGEVAYLAFAGTRAEWRRRGAQLALIQARMAAAARAGCRWLASETGAPLSADEPNPSYQNMLRVGMRPVALRDNYGPPDTAWRPAYI